MKRVINKKNIFLWVTIFIYSLITLAEFRYSRFTADSMLYISIAEKYLSGNLKDAINGYWGPFLAWLIAPLLFLGVSDVMTVNIIDLISGVLIFISIWKLLERLGVSDWMRDISILTSLPVVVWFSLVQPMDILLTGIVAIYLVVILRDDYSERIINGILCGILGSLVYFTKSYGFPFFIAHFLSMNLFYFIKERINKQRVLKNAIAGFVVFFLISGIWIGLISDKYGYFTFSTMSDKNFNLPPPEALNKGREFNVPVFYKGFFAPPNETAFVVWEDPSYLEGNKWKPWHSLMHFKHFMKLLFKNMIGTIEIFNDYSFFSIAIIATVLLLIFEKIPQFQRERLILFYILFTITLYTGGYLIFHVEERYLWIVDILLLVTGGYIINFLIKNAYIKNLTARFILLFFFVISFTIIPIKSIIQARGMGNMDYEMHELSLELKEYNIKGNIASNRLGPHNHDAWHKTFRLAYWLGCRYYGQPAEGITDNELEAELRRYNIDYYFLWGESPYIPGFLQRHKEITGGKIDGVKIFSLKEMVGKG